jgi:hypothetical protein
MSVSTEVHRTLVKSPPELWAELSDPAALARHLGELGEIRITSVEPETKVEWESEGLSGVVQLKQSGWGTRVTLSVTRAASTDAAPEQPEAAEPAPEPQALAEPAISTQPEPAPETDPEPTAPAEPGPVGAAEPESVAPEPETANEGPDTEPDTRVESEAVAEPAPEPTPEPKLGFFARLFGRRKVRAAAALESEANATAEPAVEADAAAEAEPETLVEPEIVAMAAPEPIYPDPPAEPKLDLAAELGAVEAQMAADTTELLTGVLDRLGAAHHRPFSRG